MIITRLNAVPRGGDSDTCTGPWPPPGDQPRGRPARVRAATAGRHRHAAPHSHEAPPGSSYYPDAFPRAAPREPPAERQCQAPPAPGDTLPAQPGPRSVMSAATPCFKQGSPAGQGQM